MSPHDRARAVKPGTWCAEQGFGVNLDNGKDWRVIPTTVREGSCSLFVHSMAVEPNSRGHFKSFLPTVFLPVPSDPSSVRLGVLRVFHLGLVVTICGINTFNITAASYFKRLCFPVQASSLLLYTMA